MVSKQIKKEWTCETCGLSLCTSVLDQVRHQESCVQNEVQKLVSIKSTDSLSQSNSLKREYFCEHCKNHLSLTSTEILKHIREHKSQEAKQQVLSANSEAN
jgi:novel protein similar to mouse DEAH (asp-glu-ala-his) box polypeptide 34 (dhx34)